jgi:two-component system alkaline phosphatase synthesis response regulator PhoP
MQETTEEFAMSQGRILVVEDDFDISNLLRIYFESQGFQVTVAARGNDALKACRHNLPNVIVLDIQLPDIDGYEVCRQLRGNLRTSHIPILFLTQRDERSDKIAGLELGADDYITKPFSPRELVARVRAVLRRARGELSQPEQLQVGDLEIDLKGHTILKAGEPVHLTRTEFRLLAVLAQHAGQILTRAQLLDQVHGVASVAYDRSIDAHIKNLRRKLEPDPSEPRYILSIYGVGYKFADKATW